MIISKFNASGSELISHTYIGGKGNDFPHSMIVNDNNELYMLGSSNSYDYPTTLNAIQRQNGGELAGRLISDYESDIVVSVMNNDFSQLLHSTYYGAEGTDGQNYLSQSDIFPKPINNSGTKLNLNFVNYGDEYKGEIVLDKQGNVYISSMSSSKNFPTKNGFQNNKPISSTGVDTLQAGVVLKLNPSLTNTLWASYLTGPNHDAAYGIKVGASGDLYVSGCISNGHTFVTPDSHKGAGGGNDGLFELDGYVAKINPNGSSIDQLRLIGTTGHDQVFFVQIGPNDGVYVMGQTDKSNEINVSPIGTYKGKSGGMFIRKYAADLSNDEFTSTFGKISPTAFLVDDCQKIFAVGHSGYYNTFNIADFDTLNAVDEKSSAGFYMIALEKDAREIAFGSLYGGLYDHVDGGTSRFDSRSKIYQSICADTRNLGTIGAYSASSKAPSGVENDKKGLDFSSFVVKMNLDISRAIADPVDLNIPNQGCAPFRLDVSNPADVNNPDLFFDWNFGDGTQLLDVYEPFHNYNNAGDYDITYVFTDSSKCIPHDTLSFTIDILDVPNTDIDFEKPNINPCSPTAEYEINVSADFPGNFQVQWDWGDQSTFATDTVNNGSSTESHTYNDYGTYEVVLTYTELSCNITQKDSFEFNYYEGVPPKLSVDALDTIYGCAEIFSATPTGIIEEGVVDNYYWSIGTPNGPYQNLMELNPTLTFNSPGIYQAWFHVETSDTTYCVNKDSTPFIIHAIKPQDINIEVNTIQPPECAPNAIESYPVEATASSEVRDISEAIWIFDEGDKTDTIRGLDVSYEYTQTGDYIFTLITYDSLCNIYDTSFFDVTYKKGTVLKDLIIPNIFTPNGDEKNDLFEIDFKTTSDIDDYKKYFNYDLEIYNRWGNLLYTGGKAVDGEESLWDGVNEKSGKPVKEGVYFYILNFENTCVDKNQKLPPKQGKITVIR